MSKLAGAALVGAAVAAVAGTSPHDDPHAAAQDQHPGTRHKARHAHSAYGRPARRLPAGRSTATSFWGRATASGAPMSSDTIASPYWPLGTTVKITYHHISAIGVVKDFGPAEWAVAQHDPPAIIDLSEPMMQHLTGHRVNAITVAFRMLERGHGPTYRDHGPGYALATGPA